MKGQINNIEGIILILIALVIIMLFLTQVSSKKPAEENYLGFPGGFSNVYLETNPEFQQFIATPAAGETVVVGGQSTIIPEKDWFEKAQASANSLIGAKVPNNQIDTNIMANTLFYSLGVDGNCGTFEESKPFGSANLHMTIDTAKLDEYLQLKYKQGFDPGPSSDAVLEKIKIKICWDEGKLCLDKDGAIVELKKDETTTELQKAIPSLKEFKSSDQCKPKTDNSGKTIPNTFECDFKLEKLIKKCCPSNIDITAEFVFNLGNNVNIPVTPYVISPTLVYYFDYPSDPTHNEGFENFGSGFENCIKPKNGEKGPGSNILIYPCRAIVSGKNQLKQLSETVKGPSQEDLDFEDCDSVSADKVGEYKLIGKESGWLCRDTAKNTNGFGPYYLVNYYAFCPLDGESLPESPEVSYLENRIPSGKDESAWLNAKAEIDKKYGLAILGSTPVEPVQFDPKTPVIIPTEPKKPNDPAKPILESWTINTCGSGCKPEFGCNVIRLKPDYYGGSIEASSNKDDANYICKKTILTGDNDISICYADNKGCVIELKSDKGSSASCPCSKT